MNKLLIGTVKCPVADHRTSTAEHSPPPNIARDLTLHGQTLVSLTPLNLFAYLSQWAPTCYDRFKFEINKCTIIFI